MWYWDPINCNEALYGIHNLTECIRIEEDEHPFKKGNTPDGKMWSNDENNNPVLTDIPPPKHEVLIDIVNTERNSLIAQAVRVIDLWQTELQLDIISEKDKASLINWLAYIKALQAIDVEAAPDISWPARPDI